MQSLDLKTLLSLLWLSVRRYKILAFLTFVLVLTPAVLVGMTKKPVYVAKATVLIKENNYASSDLGNHLHTPRGLGIQFAILKSQYLAGRVVDNLPKDTLRDLEEHAEYNDFQGKLINMIRTTLGKSPIVVDPKQRASMELRNARMSFKGVGGGGIIEIDGESIDPKVALSLVNSYIDTFKEISSHFALEQQADLDKSLSLQILNARSLLKKSEEDLLDYQNRTQKNSGKKHRPVDVSSYLSQESGMLSSLRARKAVLLLTETESHPDVLAVTQEIRELERKVGTLHMMSGTDGQADVSGSAWENFLESNIHMDKGLLADLEQERSSARITADSNLENLIVIDPALRPTRPEMAKGLKIGIMGVVGGLGGAVAVPFLLVFFRRPVQGESHIKNLSGLPNFANIPRVPPRHVPEKNGDRIPRVDQKADVESVWIFQKEFESMFFRLKKLFKHQNGHVLLVTSAGPDEGKSMTALNMALTMAHFGNRVVLVDGDTIRGHLQQSLRVWNSFSADIFLPKGDGGAPRPIDWTEGNLAVVSLPKEGPSFWSEHPEVEISKWFEILRFQSDFVIIDSAPVLASTDLLGLSSFIDGVLVIARNSVTREKDFLRMGSILSEHHFEILGTVLNDSRSPHIQYSYGYTPDKSGERKKEQKAG
ncbi:MAG: lipopolysaccharide biosynthesis protein [Nitrospiraceae bacterium]|jgi:tyrosine-protein kinase Etk/Wzc|nr:lipopolysaccharide biosynthesis protein [Nitrospiraceae bacterium]